MFGPKVRDEQFFDAFTKHASLSVSAAGLLVDLLSNLAANSTHPYSGTPSSKGHESTKSIVDKISALEEDGDTLTHETVKRLHETWITPIDREDIRNLISHLDDVLDLTEAVSERIALFDLSSARQEALDLANILLTATKALHLAMGLLPKLKKPEELLKICVDIHELENQADKLYRQALADLFTPGNDPLNVMKWRDILDNLEMATDRCEDVANVVEGIVLQYA